MSTAKKKAPAKKLSMKDLAEQIKSSNSSLDRIVENTDAAIGELQDQMENNQATIMAAINALATNGASNKAINNPVVINTDRIEAAEQDLGEATDISNDSIEMVDGEMIHRTSHKDVDSPAFKSKMELEKFMNESVAVRIGDAMTDETAPLFDVTVNGKCCVFAYGQTKIVPRFIVEGLARARPVHYGNKMSKLDDGSDTVINPASRSLRYPFTVEQDLNSNGGKWLRAILAQA